VTRDSQKQRVYDWENAVIAPLSKGGVPFDRAQAFVDGVWLSHGWLYPPQVLLMPKQATATMATGNRAEIRIQANTPDWVILHELAHTLTANEDGHGGRYNDGHGADFVGLYIKLLERVLNIPTLMTMYTLKQAGVKFNLAARPWMQRRSGS
jgi:hypothetical protein